VCNYKNSRRKREVFKYLTYQGTCCSPSQGGTGQRGIQVESTSSCGYLIKEISILFKASFSWRCPIRDVTDWPKETIFIEVPKQVRYFARRDIFIFSCPLGVVKTHVIGY
jgi:hypothetical protein